MLFMPLISVIVPIYKVEKYLARCVKSIRNQTFTDIEIILVDDGSPDKCGEMCDAYARKDERVRVIHKANGGLSSARNVGIDEAKGEYLAFIDSDDWMDADMLEILHRIAQEKNADIVECSFRNIYNDRIIEETACTAQIIEATPLEAIESILDWKFFKPVAWNKLYSATIMQDIRYTEGKLHEDEFTTHKFFMAAKKLVYVDISKYNYDKSRTDSITGDAFRESNLDACEALSERMHLVWDNNFSQIEEKMNNVYSWVLFSNLYKAFQAKIKGAKLKATIKRGLDDYAQLNRENRPLGEQYREPYACLEKGLSCFAKYWKEK